MFDSEGSMGWKDDDSLLPITAKQMKKRRNYELVFQSKEIKHVEQL